MTIENYFMLTQEHKIHKERILELESQVKRLNEINEEQRANNEEMREFMKQQAKKIN